MEIEIALTGLLAVCGGGLAMVLIENARLREHVRDQASAVRKLQVKYNALKEQADSRIPMKIATLNMTIFQQQEKIDALTRKVAQQRRLLDQKWNAAPTERKAGASDGR